MNDEPLNVGLRGILMGFASLVAHLDAKGLIDAKQFAEMLENNADEFSPEVGAELRALAGVLKGNPPPKLTAIDGGKLDDEGPDAA